jgi:hypothetical protein
MSSRRSHIDDLLEVAAEHQLIAQLAGDKAIRRKHERLALELHTLAERFVPGVGAVFDPYLTKVMGEAFDSARKELQQRGQPDIACIATTKAIIASEKGERDPLKLRDAGLAAFGIGPNVE